MTQATAPTATLEHDRAAYWDRNGFGADGGASLAWVPIRAFGLTVRIPNTDGRRRAIGTHDLHHVVTGYGTDLIGEAEIGAWELASGCRSPAPLLLNLAAMTIGLGLSPRRIVRAWARGRATGNLYRVQPDLRRPTAQVRHELGLDAPPPRPRLRDAVACAATGALGASLLLAPLAVAVLLAIVVVGAVW